MPRLELGEYIARVVTDEFGFRPGLRDPEEAEIPKIRRFAQRREAKHGGIGIGDWSVRGVGRVVFGFRRAALNAMFWSRELPRWSAITRRLTDGGHEGDEGVGATDRGLFADLTVFLEEVQAGRTDRTPLERIEAWAGACARVSEHLPPSSEDDARFPRDELLSDRYRLRELWAFLWRTHVGTDHMPACPWEA